MTNIEQTCEALWRRLTHGVPERTVDSERDRDGNYIRGYRIDVDTWTLDFDVLKFHAMRIDWQTFTLAADCTGLRRVVEILNGDAVVFRADQDGARTEVKFTGADERYLGTQDTPATPWRITRGDAALVATIVSRPNDQYQLGKRGGQARARALSADQRSEIARKAARGRWDATWRGD